MSAPAISVKDLERSYGRLKAVDGVSFEVGAGEVVAVVGVEGSGKSTLVRLVLGLMRPHGGAVEIQGRPPGPDDGSLARVGAVLSPPGFHESWTGRANLRYAADLSGERSEKRINWVISRTGLAPVVDRPVRSCGRQVRQRLAIARALVGGPEVLVLDNPALWLEPVASRGFRMLVRRLAREAKVAALYATDVLSEAVECADRILVMDGGRIIHEGPTTQIRAACNSLVVTTEHADKATEDLVRVKGTAADVASDDMVRLDDFADPAEVTSFLVGRGHKVSELARKGMTTEELLVRIATRPLPPPPAVLGRPEEVKDVLELLDDTEIDLSAYMPVRRAQEAGRPATAGKADPRRSTDAWVPKGPSPVAKPPAEKPGAGNGGAS